MTMPVSERRPTGHRSLAARLALMAAGMFLFGYLLVPLYDLLCDVTGIGGKTGGSADAVAATATPNLTRTITVEFTATRNQQAPWEFRPEVTSIKVHPGEYYSAEFFARNLTDVPLTAQAVPSVAPGEAARYFKKTECFCFTAQHFKPGEGRDMGVTFMVDPTVPAHIDRLTLSYTLFKQET